MTWRGWIRGGCPRSSYRCWTKDSFGPYLCRTEADRTWRGWSRGGCPRSSYRCWTEDRFRSYLCGLRQTGLGEDGAEEGVLVALTVAGLRTESGHTYVGLRQAGLGEDGAGCPRSSYRCWTEDRFRSYLCRTEADRTWRGWSQEGVLVAPTVAGLRTESGHTYVGLRQAGLGEDGAEEGVLVALTVAGLRTHSGQGNLTQTCDSAMSQDDIAFCSVVLDRIRNF